MEFTNIQFEKLLDYGIKILTPLVAGIGLYYTLQIKKKFKETHLTKSLEILQAGNRELVKKSQKLIFNYKQYVSTNQISEEQYSQIVLDFNDLNERAVDCSSEINTIIFCIHFIIQSLKNENINFNNNERKKFLKVIIDFLERVVFLGTRILNIPKL